jgi:hypothetical protein
MEQVIRCWSVLLLLLLLLDQLLFCLLLQPTC